MFAAARRSNPFSSLALALARYRRNLALLGGRIAPDPRNPGDQDFLRAFWAARDRRSLRGDLRLRVRILEAIWELWRHGDNLLQEAHPAWLRSRGAGAFPQVAGA